MNLTTAIFLISEEVRLVSGVYEPETNRPKREFFKTFNEDICVGDICVVPSETRHGFTTVKITEVDLIVNHDDPTGIRWIVARVPMDEYEDIIAQEAKALELVRKADAARRKAELREAMKLSEVAGLDALPIAGHHQPKPDDAA